jgi:hypothetical protein
LAAELGELALNENGQISISIVGAVELRCALMSEFTLRRHFRDWPK